MEPARPSPEREVLRALGRLLRVPAGLAAWVLVLLMAAFYIRHRRERRCRSSLSRPVRPV